MEDMEKRSNCASLLLPSASSPYSCHTFGYATFDPVNANELERLKKRFMKLDRQVACSLKLQGLVSSGLWHPR